MYSHHFFKNVSGSKYPKKYLFNYENRSTGYQENDFYFVDIVVVVCSNASVFEIKYNVFWIL